MKKALTRLTAIMLIAVLSFSLAGCHKPGELALTVGGEEFSSGFYACAFLAADNEAQSRVYEESEKNGDTVTIGNYLEKTIDGVLYPQWVKKRAIEICQQIVAAKKLCEQNNVSTADYLENAKNNAKTDWQTNREYFEKNGIGVESYQKFCAYEQYATAYFDYLYGKDGPSEVKDDVREKFIKENYCYVNAIDVDVTKMTEKQLEDQEKEFNGFIDRVKKGESFGKIYAEVTGNTYAEKDDVTDGKGFSFTNGMLWGAENTAYESPLFKDVKDMGVNTFKIIKNDTLVEGATYMLLVYKGDIFDKKNPNIETIKTVALDDMKGDEFDKLLVEESKKITATENTKSTKQFKAEKIYHPEG